MKKYIKTRWQDNKTPVNAENLNKIEDAIENLSSNAISYSQFKEGNGIDLSTDEKGNVLISTDKSVVRSDSGISGIEVLRVSVKPGRCCMAPPMEKGKVYFVLDEETKKLKFIALNGVKIFDPMDYVKEEDPEEDKKDPYQPTPDHTVDIEDEEDKKDPYQPTPDHGVDIEEDEDY